MSSIGMYGSTAHILANKDIKPKDKAKVLVKINTEVLKDTFKTGAGAVTTAGAAAIAVGTSKKAAGRFDSILKNIGGALSKVKIQGVGPKGGAASLKNTFKNSTLGKKFLALPKPLQAAILAGTVALTLGLSLFSISSASKAGYIEAQAENKD